MRDSLAIDVLFEVPSVCAWLADRAVRTCRDYKSTYCAQLQVDWPQLKYKPFDWVAVISFAFLYADSFGEFGSQQWRSWGCQFKQAGIPVKMCVFHAYSLIQGI